MKKLVFLFALLVLLLSVAPVGAQEAGDIYVKPDGVVGAVLGALFGGLLGAGGLYLTLRGRKPAQDLTPDDRNGLLGLILVGGWLASKSPGDWDDQQVEKLMNTYGFQKPEYTPQNITVNNNALPFKPVRGTAPDFITDEEDTEG